MLWLFLPFVLLLSGVVAYAADKIAKRVGRKHVRWFGLRPKETATIVAVLSGIGISAASLAAFLLLNRSAVSTIAQADQLRPQIEALHREVKSVQKDLDAVQLERDAARRDAAQMVKDRAQAVQALQAARANLSAAQTSQKKVEAQRAELQRRVGDLTALRKNLEAQAAQSRAKLTQSEQALKASQDRAQKLDAQVLDLSLRSATAEQEAQNAQSRAAEAQRKSDAAQTQAQAAQTRAEQARQQAAQVQQQAQAQVAAQQAVLTDLASRLQGAKTQLGAARQAAQTALAQQQSAQAQRDRLTTQRDQLTQERTQATRDRDQVRSDLAALRTQQQQLRTSNAALAQQLAGTRQSLELLRSQYRSTTTELSVSRNADLAYPKNDLVYAGVVPSVRNLDTFLNYAAQAAEGRGARGNDQGAAVRLDKASRAALETKLRGLNTSSFVLCRATQNSSAGFPVDLSCDARPNTVLYRGGQIIRRATLNLSPGAAARGGSSTQAQINELVQDTVLDLTSRGVPADYIDNQGLDVTEFASLLAKLSGRSGTVVVGLAAHDDVKPASRVDLYAVLP